MPRGIGYGRRRPVRSRGRRRFSRSTRRVSRRRGSAGRLRIGYRF